MAFLAISGLIFLIYLPIAAIATLGLLALWSKVHRPKLWQVLAVTAIVVFVPWMVTGSTAAHRGLWHSLASGILAYIPVMVPAVLWALQRRDSNGEFSPLAKRSGSLLVAYIILVVLVLPMSAIGLAFLPDRGG